MATQRIMIAKIGGAAGTTVLQRFTRWTRSAEQSQPSHRPSDKLSASVAQDIDNLVSSLRLHAGKPPVVFYAEYVDMWSMGDVFPRWFPTEHCAPLLEAASERFEVGCYVLPDNGELAANIARHMRRKTVRERNPQEYRWFLVNLLEATLAWTPLVETAAIIFVREVLGALICDSEIEKSLARVPDWIAEPQ